MPGIVGLITKMPRKYAERELLQMIAALRHQSFYATGAWIDESLGVYMGWVALKNSFCDGMPLRNERSDVFLAFSGQFIISLFSGGPLLQTSVSLLGILIMIAAASLLAWYKGIEGRSPTARVKARDADLAGGEA